MNNVKGIFGIMVVGALLFAGAAVAYYGGTHLLEVARPILSSEPGKRALPILAVCLVICGVCILTAD